MSLGISAALQSLLNKFSATQPALHDTFNPAATSGIALGDLMQAATSCATTVKVTYTATAASGTVGAHALPLTLPAGAKLLAVYTDATTALTSAGSATVAVAAGATSLIAAVAYNDTSLVGFDSHSISPVKLAVATPLTLTVAVAALTGGSVDFYVTYIA